MLGLLLLRHAFRKRVVDCGDDFGSAARPGSEELHDQLLADVGLEPFSSDVFLVAPDYGGNLGRDEELGVTVSATLKTTIFANVH